MSLWNLFDWTVFALIAACIAVWPTQLISDNANRWLRIVIVGSLAMQLLIDGPRAALVPVYLVAVLFALLLVADRRVKDEPSGVRESQEGSLKKVIRWTLMLGCAAALLTSVVLWFLYPRVG